MNIIWKIKTFENLSPYELYQILKLRINVFMLEQECLYPECDDKDLKAEHLFGLHENHIIAYARLLPPGISYKESSIGRVVTASDYRKFGIGRQLMERGIEQILSEFPNNGLRISAQAHLQSFYQNLGFQKETEPYLEDNIPHIEMALHVNK
ncbi:acetyltransferase [Sphingobacterium alkalisoli]|uniref:GNAT family N-acetyltransferase n=1 Tax=Sphingobacterium alkalisoli TaxID=1874115 RepID=UPI0019A79A65|nr:GNAT family N-acetyltransferase [Sphingobacterium alkalisoli]GGH26325.1 acetyltransferase [Sphingobacterium alkalisoli]